MCGTPTPERYHFASPRCGWPRGRLLRGRQSSESVRGAFAEVENSVHLSARSPPRVEPAGLGSDPVARILRPALCNGRFVSQTDNQVGDVGHNRLPYLVIVNFVVAMGEEIPHAFHT